MIPLMCELGHLITWKKYTHTRRRTDTVTQRFKYIVKDYEEWKLWFFLNSLLALITDGSY